MQMVQNDDDSVTWSIEPSRAPDRDKASIAPGLGAGSRSSAPTDRLGRQRDRTRLTRVRMRRAGDHHVVARRHQCGFGLSTSVLIWSDGTCSFRVTLNT
jgi:hypothetical protein